MNAAPLLAVAVAAPLLVGLALWLSAAEAGLRGGLRRLLLSADRVLTTTALAAACAALLVAVAAGFWQVIARFLLDQPAAWSEALVRTALIWMAFLGLAATLRSGALVAIDVARRLSPPALRRALDAATLAANLSLMGVLFWFGWLMAERVRFQEMAGLEVSMAWGYAAIPVGAGFAMLGAIAHLLDPPRGDEAQGA
ncbi:MAG: TRAP transporter small permease [Rhodovarius sp.]|nr:TRAP transporter small permease [Rhodovarius sp.]MDW8315235.1 TRAP transporter small permease [Rhodovarius sp.]